MNQDKPLILIVEPDSIQTEVYKIRLRNEFDLIFANSADEAIRELNNEHNFSLITTELMIPGIGGVNLIRYIRDRSNHSSVPILCVAAALIPQSKAELKQVGCTDMLCKPFHYDDLRAKVKEMIN